ncbi:hypothetical protein ACMFMG_008739 [Clarireedia jacksonii]
MTTSACTHYNFGVEVELVVRPCEESKAPNEIDWYSYLVQKLNDHDVPAVYNGDFYYRKHPEYYSSKWCVMQDGSLVQIPPYISMEAVSPIFNTQQPVADTISSFWETMNVHFDVQKNRSCGGHVHVTPMREGHDFTLDELKKFAFASVIYEDYIREILPSLRRDNNYCKLNSQSTDKTGDGCRLYELLLGGKTIESLRAVASEIRGIRTRRKLCIFMQKTRNVLWNLERIYRNSSGVYVGTIEFRGGSQFVSTRNTLSWVAFVLGFVNIALEADPLDSLSSYKLPSDADMVIWWSRIKGSIAQFPLSRYLPDTYQIMQKM